MKPLIQNMSRETICGYEVSEEQKKIRNIQLNMAECLLELCASNNLKIWAISGTMLGAVRHKGFIPWDDDMDFAMFREDYDKLQKIAPEEIKEPFFFQSPYTEEGYYRGHSQMRYSDSSMVMRYDATLGYTFNQGIFIDIFVLDGCPDKTEELNALIYQRELILQYLWNRHYPIRRRSKISAFMGYQKQKRILKEKTEWTDIQLYSYVEDMFRAYPVTVDGKSSPAMMLYLERWVRQNRWFEEIVMMPFEEIMVPVPALYHEILTHEYGDYNKFVIGTSLHNDLICDPDVPYKEYLGKLKKSAFGIFLYSVKNTLLKRFK